MLNSVETVDCRNFTIITTEKLHNLNSPKYELFYRLLYDFKGIQDIFFVL